MNVERRVVQLSVAREVQFISDIAASLHYSVRVVGPLRRNSGSGGNGPARQNTGCIIFLRVMTENSNILCPRP